MTVASHCSRATMCENELSGANSLCRWFGGRKSSACAPQIGQVPSIPAWAASIAGSCSKSRSR